MYKCLCLAVSDKDIENVMKEKKCTREEAYKLLLVGTCCGICTEDEDGKDCCKERLQSNCCS